MGVSRLGYDLEMEGCFESPVWIFGMLNGIPLGSEGSCISCNVRCVYLAVRSQCPTSGVLVV